MHAIKALSGAISAALLLAPPVFAEGETEGGFKISTGNYSFQVGGRLQFDTSYMDGIFVGEDPTEDITDDDGNVIGTRFVPTDDSRWNSELRRTRIFVAGKVLNSYSYKLQWDLSTDAQNADSDTDSDVKDAFINWNGWTDWFQVKLGQFKEPFSLQELTSSKYITAVERAFISDVFAPGRSQGISVRGNGNWGANHLYYQVGGFVNNQSFNDDGGDVHALTARAVYTLQFNQDPNKFLHLGGAFSSRNQGDQSNSLRIKPGVHLAERITLDSRPKADDTLLGGLEVAFNWQRYGAQAEYYFGSDNGADGDKDYDFGGGYIQASAFITPDSRGYKYANAAFDKVKPERSYGAWQVYLRFATSDFDDGGRNSDDDFDTIDVGVGWFVNNNTRFNLVYTRAEYDGDIQVDGSDEDTGNAVTLRSQIFW